MQVYSVEKNRLKGIQKKKKLTKDQIINPVLHFIITLRSPEFSNISGVGIWFD